MYSLFALSLVACTRSGVDQGDDAPEVDAGDDGPAGVGCTPTSPRAIAPEAFVGPTGLQSRITGFIDSAQQTLDVAMYLFTVDAIADRLVAAKQRGVAVRVLFDPDHEGNSGARSTLTSGGVQHRNAPSLYSFSHAKYMVADGATALIMSANFNVDAMNNERNYGIIDRDAGDVADRSDLRMDWAAGGGEPPKPAASRAAGHLPKTLRRG
jgi:phosphatidylserine/phosphatidylglycerophosphate/cardiolipin synthase-like enzyme